MPEYLDLRDALVRRGDDVTKALSRRKRDTGFPRHQQMKERFKRLKERMPEGFVLPEPKKKQQGPDWTPSDLVELWSIYDRVVDVMYHCHAVAVQQFAGSRALGDEVEATMKLLDACLPEMPQDLRSSVQLHCYHAYR